MPDPRTVQPGSNDATGAEKPVTIERGASASALAGDDIIGRLSAELAHTQSRLHTAREESIAAGDEFRAANEELQSICEELQTVNSELELKLEAISRAHSDLQNLMAATDFGTLFLDSTLRIKRFTDRATELFGITPSDEGRPIADFAHQLEYDEFIRDARAVLSDLAPIRREIRSRHGRWYDVRMRPYRTVDDRIEGVVITFVETTDRRHVEEALRASEQQLQRLKALVELSRAPIFMWDIDEGIIEWNRGSEELYGFTRAEALGKRKELLLRTEVPGSSFQALRAELTAKGSWAGELRQRTKDGQVLTVESRIELATFDGHRLVLESTRDITERKEWERRQHLLLRELTHRVRNTLAVVQSLAQQSLARSPSPALFVERFTGRLAALSNAHSLLVQSDWKGADLRALADGQLAAYMAQDQSRVRMQGPSILLGPDLATPFGLVLHELATNASKHGALSIPQGRVELSWNVSNDRQRMLHVLWREVSGPPVSDPGAASFGTTLIERGIPNAVVNRQFPPEGFVCTIDVPLGETSNNLQ